MKKFITKTILFIIPLIIIFYTKPIYLIITDKYKDIVAGSEIYYSIRKSKKKSNSKILIIGDSVGKQLFNNINNESGNINSLACNQAIGVIGQYFLLNNYLNTGNRPQKVYLIYTPFSFKNNLDQIYTFHYFLKPFYTREYIKMYTNTAIKQVKKIPFYYLSHEPYILTSNWAPNFLSADIKKFKLISPISIEYLKKIKKLSIKYKFKIILLPTPTSIEKKDDLLKSIDKHEIKQTNMEKEFNDFFQKIIYLDNSEFIDGTHLKEPSIYTKLYKEKWVK